MGQMRCALHTLAVDAYICGRAQTPVLGLCSAQHGVNSADARNWETRYHCKPDYKKHYWKHFAPCEVFCLFVNSRKNLMLGFCRRWVKEQGYK